MKRVNGKESFLILILPLFNILFGGNFWCPVSYDLSRIVLCSHNYVTIQIFRKKYMNDILFLYFATLNASLASIAYLWTSCSSIDSSLLLTLSYCNRNRTNSIMNIFACTLLFANTPLGKIPGSAIARSKAVMFENYLY